MPNKAFSAITIKRYDDEAREIEGIASTPAPDRVKDIVEPLGLSFERDAPLLLNHDQAQPVGTVQFGQATRNGLPFKARIAKVREPGVVKDRTDEAWHSVKAGLIKGVSIGFMPTDSAPRPGGQGMHYKKATVHELSLVAIPANTQAIITAFKSLAAAEALPEPVARPVPPAAPPVADTRPEAPIKTTITKGNEQMNTTNHMIRKAIAETIFSYAGPAAAEYAGRRWGADASVTKALVSATGTSQAPGFVAGAITRDAFVEAVFTQSILSRLPGLLLVPADTRVNVDVTPIIAPFIPEMLSAPAFAGNFDVTLTSRRKVSLVVVMNAELVKATGDAAESFISGQVTRALSRGMDAALTGSQAAGPGSPPGLLSAAGTVLSGFDAAVDAFAGDFATACVIAHPRTAVSLRSPQEQEISATGGTYAGFPVITSIAVPVGTVFLVDGSRVIAHIGNADVETSKASTFVVDDGSGAVSTKQTSMFFESKVALKGTQYVDWTFADGAVTAFTLAAGTSS